VSQAIERIYGNSNPTHAVIWLHGLGATADDFVPVIPYLGLSKAPAIRFIFPQAPDRPITINSGYVMPGWYDIKGTEITDKEDLPGMTQSRNMLELLIAEQMAKGIPSTHILLAGFSQGGAVAYYTGIRSSYRLAGILALSTYLPFLNSTKAEHSGVNLHSPILAMHGKSDAVVPLSAGKLSADGLSALGYSVEWREYDMEHTVLPEQLEDIGAWINELFRSGTSRTGR
jgi:phospholipase/carboxylesterase